MQTVVFTLCSNNYLAHAKTLGDSIIKTNPHCHFIIGLVDKRDAQIDYGFFEPFEIIDYDSIGYPFFEEMVAVYNVIEFNTAVKPFYLEFLLQKYGEGAKVYYIDPDIVLYGSMKKLHDTLDACNIVLTPNLTKASLEVNTGELASLRHGMYNLGFIGVKYGDETFRFVRWWQNRLRKHCVIDKPRGLFVDQKWIDLAPLFFKGIDISDEVGYNMAWWNFTERTLLTINDEYFVNDGLHPLVFFHFSGYTPGSDAYTGRTKHPDFLLTSKPELMALFNDYSNRLVENGLNNYSLRKPLLNFAPQRPNRSFKSRLKKKLKSFLSKAVKM